MKTTLTLLRFGIHFWWSVICPSKTQIVDRLEEAILARK
jgi:hypothetical protein